MDWVGKTLTNRYRLGVLIGRGGMSEVYRAWDANRQCEVAIKLFREDLAEDAEFLSHLAEGAGALAELSHANIVRFYGLERDGPVVFIVMDYVPGVTLRRRILESAGAPLPSREVHSIVQQVCAALHYAHGEGLTHGAIRPGNILIQPDGHVMLSDFSFASAADATSATTWEPGVPAYMSPEQCLGQSLDGRADLYSLGIVIYEMLAGRRPFDGGKASITGAKSEKVRWEQMNATPPPLREFNRELSPQVEAVVLRCLEKKPEDRYANILEFLEAFQDALGIAILPGSAKERKTDPLAMRAMAAAAVASTGESATTGAAAGVPPMPAPPLTIEPTPPPAAVPIPEIASVSVQAPSAGRQSRQKWIGLGLVGALVACLAITVASALALKEPIQQLVGNLAKEAPTASLANAAPNASDTPAISPTHASIPSATTAPTPENTATDTPVPASPTPLPSPTSTSIMITEWEAVSFVTKNTGCQIPSALCWMSNDRGFIGYDDVVLMSQQSYHIDSSWKSPYLVFWQQYSFDKSGNVSVKAEGGMWAYLKVYGKGKNMNWHQEYLDLSAYKGESIIIKFTLEPLHVVSIWNLQEIRIVPDFTPPD
jgi:serine/threonine protein kinase